MNRRKGGGGEPPSEPPRPRPANTSAVRRSLGSEILDAVDHIRRCGPAQSLTQLTTVLSWLAAMWFARAFKVDDAQGLKIASVLRMLERAKGGDPQATAWLDDAAREAGPPHNVHSGNAKRWIISLTEWVLRDGLLPTIPPPPPESVTTRHERAAGLWLAGLRSAPPKYREALRKEAPDLTFVNEEDFARPEVRERVVEAFARVLARVDQGKAPDPERLAGAGIHALGGTAKNLFSLFEKAEKRAAVKRPPTTPQ